MDLRRDEESRRTFGSPEAIESSTELRRAEARGLLQWKDQLSSSWWRPRKTCRPGPARRQCRLPAARRRRPPASRTPVALPDADARPARPSGGHRARPRARSAGRRGHARRVRQLRLPALPRSQRAHRRRARPLRRPDALRVPPASADRQRHRPPGGGPRRMRPQRRRVLEGARRPDVALGAIDGGRPAVRRARARRRRCADDPRGPGDGARRRRHRERPRERRRIHADVLRQRPPLRRPLGRKLAVRRTARLARSPHPLGGARLRGLGALGRRAAAADVDPRRRDQQLRLGRGLRGVLAAALGARVREPRAAHAGARLDQPRPALRLLPDRRPRDQARVHGGPPRERANPRRCRSPPRSAG